MTERAGIDRRADHRRHGYLASVTNISAASRANRVMSTKHTFGVGLRSVIFELGVLAQERELQVARRAVALLGNDDVRNAFARGILVVYLFAINQQNQVAVL